MIPYTYLIGWTKHNKWYYGCQYNSNADPTDLWVTYFTSSKKVKNFREQNGEPDMIMVCETFDSQIKAREWEDDVLLSIPKDQREYWLNVKYGVFRGIVRTKEMTDKIRNKLLGRKDSKETRLKKSNSKKGKPNNKPSNSHSEITKKKLKEKREGNRKLRCSCVLCRKELPRQNISQHYNGVLCNKFQLFMKQSGVCSCIKCKRTILKNNIKQHFDGQRCKGLRKDAT